MFFRLLDRLSGLSATIDFIHEREAKIAVRSVLKTMRLRLSAHISEIYLLSKKKDSFGERNLKFARFIGDYNEKIAPGHKIREPEPWEIGKPGVWTWFYETHKMRPIWVEDVKSKPMINAIDHEIEIPRKHHRFNYSTRSFIMIPLVKEHHENKKYHADTTFRGFFNIEFDEIYKFEGDLLLDQLKTISNAIATLLWKYDTLIENEKQTEDQINIFVEQNEKDIELYSKRTAFFIPTIVPELKYVDDFLKEIISSEGIRMVPEDSESDIPTKEQLDKAHFGVFNITDAIPHQVPIMQMMQNEGKKLLIFKNKNCDIKTNRMLELIDSKYCFEYSIKNEKLYNVSSLREKIRSFIEQEIENNLVFRNATIYEVNESAHIYPSGEESEGLERKGPNSFDVVLSFAREDRDLAENLANYLREDDFAVFYDKYNQASLWGKNLYDHLTHIYKRSAKYCVVFISEHYVKKAWTNRERQAALDRALIESKEYILPIQIDETKLPGLDDSIGYLNIKDLSVKDVYKILKEKLSSTETTR